MTDFEPEDLTEIVLATRRSRASVATLLADLDAMQAAALEPGGAAHDDRALTLPLLGWCAELLRTRDHEVAQALAAFEAARWSTNPAA
ncbi:MAG: hypothetical protein JWL73_1096 [Actinomycetia bacterium]|nr:hypothetical protein [Actinomycetes bacterium]